MGDPGWSAPPFRDALRFPISSKAYSDGSRNRRSWRGVGGVVGCAVPKPKARHFPRWRGTGRNGARRPGGEPQIGRHMGRQNFQTCPLDQDGVNSRANSEGRDLTPTPTQNWSTDRGPLQISGVLRFDNMNATITVAPRLGTKKQVTKGRT